MMKFAALLAVLFTLSNSTKVVARSEYLEKCLAVATSVKEAVVLLYRQDHQHYSVDSAYVVKKNQVEVVGGNLTEGENQILKATLGEPLGPFEKFTGFGSTVNDLRRPPAQGGFDFSSGDVDDSSIAAPVQRQGVIEFSEYKPSNNEDNRPKQREDVVVLGQRKRKIRVSPSNLNPLKKRKVEGDNVQPIGLIDPYAEDLGENPFPQGFQGEYLEEPVPDRAPDRKIEEENDDSGERDGGEDQKRRNPKKNTRKGGRGKSSYWSPGSRQQAKKFKNTWKDRF